MFLLNCPSSISRLAFSYLILEKLLKEFFFWPAAFDCMVIVMRCKIDESVICKNFVTMDGLPLKNAAVKNWS